MAEKAQILNIKTLPQEKQIDLDSGRQIRVQQTANEEIIEIVETQGEVIMKIRLTEDGPVVSLQGTRLELKSTESIVMESKNIEIRAEQKAVIHSRGNLELASSDKMDINSDDDITVVGKMIHLN